MNELYELFIECLPSLLSGIQMTIKIAVLALLFAFIIGMIVALMSISKNKIIKSIATVYVNLVRGVPVFVLAIYIYFGIAALLNITFTSFVAAVITLSINASAYLAEIFRGGIEAIDFGQTEAARSLGLSYGKTMIYVILPQAIKIMIPSLMNQFITTLKDTSILSVITVRELMMNSQIIVARNFKAFEIYTFAVVFYIVVVNVLSWISRRLEKRLKYDYRS